MKNNVVFIMVNKNYFSLAVAFLNSIKKNWPNHPPILCHYSDLSKDDLEYLGKYSDLKFIHMDLDKNENNLSIPMLRDANMSITYAKLRAWSEEYEEYDNILYLDIDTLILKPLDELFDENEFVIMNDPIKLYFQPNDENISKLLEEDGILSYFNEDRKCPMGNAGVFLLPKKYRTKENYEFLLYLCYRYNSFNYFGDQSIITLWCLKNNIPFTLDRKYNFFSLFFNGIEYDLADISIIHFILVKPSDTKFMEWPLLKNHKEELRTLFNYYAELTHH